LKQFAQQTTLIAGGHSQSIRTTVKPSATIQFERLYFVAAPPEDVVLAYARSVGNRTVHVSRGRATTVRMDAEFEAFLWKGARMTSVSTNLQMPVSTTDQWLTKLVPGWLNLRFGRTYRSTILDLENKTFYKDDIFRLEELKGVASNLKVYPKLSR
jgi:hypothetical protein